MAWVVEIDPLAEKELAKLDHQVAVRILKFLNERLKEAKDPRLLGENLKGKYSDYWKYRVGDYRIISRILDSSVTIVVIKIGNRREVYS